MKKTVIKFISTVLSFIMIISCTVPAFAVIATTQESAAGVNSSLSLAPYTEFNAKLYAEEAFFVPGLNSTVSYDKDFKFYNSVDTMIPQGMCTIDHYTLITAYDETESSKSVIYVLDYSKRLVKTLILPDSYHVGGIAYDIQNRLILVTKGSDKCVGLISADDFYRYLRFSSSFVKIEYTISQSVSDVKIPNASGVTYKNGKVYLSYFASGSDSVAYCYTPSYNPTDKKYTLTYKYKFSLPSYTQGITMAKYKDKTRLFVSVSYGRSESKSVYCSYLYSYVFDEETGTKTFDNILTCPPMLQQTYVSGGKLFCLFESASNIYKKENKDPIDIVYPIRLSALCDEKNGSAVNIIPQDIAGGKQINIYTNIPNAKIYYSSSVPYISNKNLVNGYAYNAPYKKTSSGMVYAVAVADGRIVASDAVYVTVSKAFAPSGLKVSAYSSKAVNLKWTKASSASGYYIYRSTKQNSDYKLIATVSSSKSTYKDKTVKSNKKYYYKVKAYSKGYVDSSYSNIISIKTKKS